MKEKLSILQTPVSWPGKKKTEDFLLRERAERKFQQLYTLRAVHPVWWLAPSLGPYPMEIFR
jgi:hypothetical protein